MKKKKPISESPGHRVEYQSNNSGGYWWLSDADWYRLEKAGWSVRWNKAGRSLGSLAQYATRRGLTLEQAIKEFKEITGADTEENGCSCCGTPHNFTYYRGDKYINSHRII